MDHRLKPMIDCPCGCGAFGAPDRRTGHPRACHDGCAHCAHPPKKRPASQRIPTRVRRQIAVRSGGVCEAKGRTPDNVCDGVALHAHHRRTRSQGRQATPMNLLHVCYGCHDWIHNNVEAAVGLDLLEHTSANGPLTSGVRLIGSGQ